jgi:S1-C subfamily serine protease
VTRPRRTAATVLFTAFGAIAAVAIAALLIPANDSIEDRPHVGVSTFVPPRGHKTPNPTPSVQVVTSGTEIATGFAVGRDRIVTVAHVLDGAVTVAGTRARVVRVDRRSDLALLALRGSAAPQDPPALAVESARAGSRLRLLRLRDGRPSAQSVDVRRAIVAHVRAAGAHGASTRPALELAARVSPGDSGAPLLSDSGALAGVLFAASRGRDNTAYAVDASAVKRLLAPR